MALCTFLRMTYESSSPEAREAYMHSRASHLAQSAPGASPVNYTGYEYQEIWIRESAERARTDAKLWLPNFSPRAYPPPYPSLLKERFNFSPLFFLPRNRLRESFQLSLLCAYLADTLHMIQPYSECNY